MKNKGAITLALALVLVVGVTVLMADSNWQGTFTGDRTGVWKGTIYDGQEPVYYEGVWKTTDQDPPDIGTWYGEAELIGRYYVIDAGIVYDEDGEPMGRWSGRFPAYDDTEASGRWSWDSTASGTWSGWSY